jgi:hypothetical protein
MVGTDSVRPHRIRTEDFEEVGLLLDCGECLCDEWVITVAITVDEEDIHAQLTA